ncbi:hypothetical protein TrLO_g6834 [Triparma laevis f. longispina]|nr:hypothetical protein TrLO_g6834 [Triparma laevis f. longispina]
MYKGDDAIAASSIPLMYGVCECFLLMGFGGFAHYMNWTYADKKELSIVKAMLSINQDASKEGIFKVATKDEGGGVKLETTETVGKKLVLKRNY